jgi:hypothetical protein
MQDTPFTHHVCVQDSVHQVYLRRRWKANLNVSAPAGGASIGAVCVIVVVAGVVATGAWVVAIGVAVVATGAAVVDTGVSVAAAGAAVVATGVEVVATGADVVATGASVVWAAEDAVDSTSVDGASVVVASAATDEVEDASVVVDEPVVDVVVAVVVAPLPVSGTQLTVNEAQEMLAVHFQRSETLAELQDTSTYCRPATARSGTPASRWSRRSLPCTTSSPRACPTSPSFRHHHRGTRPRSCLRGTMVSSM